MALPFTTIRHHSSPSVFLTYIIYSTDFCYLVTAQERTVSARQWYTRRRAPFPLACFPRAQRSLLSPLWYRHDTSQRLLRRLLDLCTGCAGGSKSETSTLLSTLQTAAFWTGLAMRCVLLLRRFPWNVNTEVSSPWFLLFKKSWCVRNPAYLPIESRERPQIAIIWLFDRCISLNSTYSKMIYYEIGSKRSLRIRKAKWQRRTNYITQALSGHARVSRHVVKLYKRSPSVKTSNIARTCHQNLIKGFVQFSENMAPVAASFIVVIAGKIASFDLQSPTLLTLIFVDYGTLGVILLSTWWKQHREKNDDLCFCRVDYKVF